MEENGFTAELENALSGAEKLAVEKSAEIIKQEWPKIQQTFGQLIKDGESDMKVSVDVFLSSDSNGIGVKAGMTYKVVRKASVGLCFARFDGTVQQELPICDADGKDEDDGRPAVNLEETAVRLAYINGEGQADLDALFSMAKEIFTTACRNSWFLLIRQMGVTLEEAQAIMENMRNAGDLDPAFDPLPYDKDNDETDQEPAATESDATQVDLPVEDVPSDASVKHASEWAATEEESAELLAKAIELLSKSARARPSTLQRRLGLSFAKSEALFRAATMNIDDGAKAEDAAIDGAAADTSAKACVDCAKFDECPIAKPNYHDVQCDGFAARGGAQ